MENIWWTAIDIKETGNGMGCWEWFSDVSTVAREGPSQNGEKGTKLTTCLFYHNLITILVQRDSAHQTLF